MNRTLLLIPFLAIFLFACHEKHIVASPPPPAPDPNAYNTAPPVNTNTGYSGSNSGSSSSNNNVTTGTATVTPTGADTDTTNHIVGKPNAHQDTTDLVVSFISKGAGIDYAAKKKLDDWLAEKSTYDYYISAPGREGEIQYCFDLSNRNAINRAKAVSDIRAVTGTNDRVLLTENVVCTHTHGNFVVAPPVLAEEAVTGSRPVADTTRLVVSFISKGAGIDYAAKANLDKYLSKHDDIAYFVTQKGREGETEYCFMLGDRKAATQVNVVKEIKAAVGNSDRVLMREQVVCTHDHANAVAGHTVVPGTPTTGPAEEQKDTSNIARLVVSFTSKGSGIDYAAKEEFEKWLGERGNVTWTTVTYGREGETNFCFQLKNMDSRQQEIFIRDVRTHLTGNDRIFVEEYAPCDKRK